MSKPVRNDGVVVIHGKEYHTVARRIADFRNKYPNYCIKTEFDIQGDDAIVKAKIFDDKGRQVSSGIAHEVRGAGNINRTSHVENAETSAVGRALAFFGMAGTEIASADEVANAINQGKQQELEQVHIDYIGTVRGYFEQINYIKNALAVDDYETAAEGEAEIPLDVLQSLWKAPSKGGVWTTLERTALKSDEMNAARKLFTRE